MERKSHLSTVLSRRTAAAGAGHPGMARPGSWHCHQVTFSPVVSSPPNPASPGFSAFRVAGGDADQEERLGRGKEW